VFSSLIKHDLGLDFRIPWPSPLGQADEGSRGN
jgi:hypothetical protein